MGVAKLLLTAIVRAMQNVSGFTPSVVAALMAIGQNMAAVAALLINSVTDGRLSFGQEFLQRDNRDYADN